MASINNDKTHSFIHIGTLQKSKTTDHDEKIEKMLRFGMVICDTSSISGTSINSEEK